MDDLGAADSLAAASKHAQAAFFLHQTAEKAIKAVAFLWDGDPWGHSVTKLISELPETVRARFEPYRKSAMALDKLYIPTRYPDSVPDILPKDAFSEEDVVLARKYASDILQASITEFDR
jgi:HEPN domain-containing protein